MTLQQLIYLTTVAECGNVTEAAEKLYKMQENKGYGIGQSI